MVHPLNKITRKAFLRKLWGFLLLPYLVPVYRMAERQSLLTKNRSLRIGGDIAEGITFTPEVIVVRQGSHLSFYSTACPHLGCRIQQIEGDLIVCPCHGSVFDLRGAVVKGPAREKLTTLNHSRDPETGEYIILLKG